MFYAIHWEVIVEGVVISVVSAFVLGMIYRFRKIILSWLHRRRNRAKRLVKIFKRFPRYSLERLRLIRQVKQLRRNVCSLETELEKFKTKSSKEDEEIAEIIEEFLLTAVLMGDWNIDEIKYEFGWDELKTQFVFDRAKELGFVTSVSRALRRGGGAVVYYRISERGRSFLRQRGCISLS